MKIILTICYTLLPFWGLWSQSVADFENFSLSSEAYLNGSNANGGFESGPVFLPNEYSLSGGYEFWTGWAISNTTDTTTPGFLNQYSTIPGGGAGNSDTYAVAYPVYGINTVTLHLRPEYRGRPITQLAITNSTYAYWSMLEGDFVAKKFGGATGNDPDFFKLTIRKYLDGVLSTDSVDFYLADYRFEDNNLDYIINTWTTLDLSALGNVDSLHFAFESSDVGMFGINTPTYFCIDNVEVAQENNVFTALRAQNIRLFPNPTTDVLFVQNEQFLGRQVQVFDIHGKSVLQTTLTDIRQPLSVQHLPAGVYVLHINHKEQAWQGRFVKR